MPGESARRRSTATLVLVVGLLALLAAGFAALGIWQLERLAWKESLIARVDQRIHAAPMPAPGPSQWPEVSREGAEYRRVQASGQFEDSRQILVTASTELGSGYWVLAPLRREDGSWLLVNRGFVPPERRKDIPPAMGSAQVVGLLRMSEPGGALLRTNDPTQGRWYSRDVQAIASALRLQGPVAPYFVDAQSIDGQKPQWPRPGLTVVQFPNNHLVYALTWFALAAGCAAAAGFIVVDARRRGG